MDNAEIAIAYININYNTVCKCGHVLAGSLIMLAYVLSAFTQADSSDMTMDGGNVFLLYTVELT